MLLQFYDDVGAAIKQTSKIKYDDEAILLSKDARVERKDMMIMEFIFKGILETGCQNKALFPNL